MSGRVQHFEIYKTMSGGRVIRVSCDCAIGRNHGYAESRALEAERATKRGRRRSPRADGSVAADAPAAISDPG